MPGAVFSVARLGADQTVTIPPAPRAPTSSSAAARCSRSSLAEPLHDGDAFLFTDEPGHELTAGVPASCWSGRSRPMR